MSALDRSRLRGRYHITGEIVMDTALHIGGHGSSTITDSPIIRNGDNQPFIPGSSLKGAFRAAVERIVPNISPLRTCGLSDADDACANRLRDETKDKQLDEQAILELLGNILCDVCRVFGSTHLASAALFHDAPMTEVWRELPEVPTQIRDGVGIDRDSERARDGVKFDFEVVPPQTTFEFNLVLENPTSEALGIIALGIQEFRSGMVPLGGIRSRGLGRCHLDDTKVQYVDFGDMGSLTTYLTDDKWQEISIQDFITKHLTSLLAKEGTHAQTAS